MMTSRSRSRREEEFHRIKFAEQLFQTAVIEELRRAALALLRHVAE